MKQAFLILTAALFVAVQLPARAQMDHPDGAPANNVFAKIFGTKLNFSATMETDIQMPGGENDMTMSGKIYFAKGDSRTEMDMTKIRGGKMTPQAVEQMKALGMDQMVSIYRNDTKIIYLIYPHMKAYAKLETPDAKTGADDNQVTKDELGRDTVDGHACVKNKYTVSDAKTRKTTVVIAWQATDLQDIPVKMEMNPPGDSADQTKPATTLHFTDIDPATPKSSLFDPPTDFKAYNDIRSMLQAEMMKKMGGGMGMPAGQPPGAGHP